VLKKGVNSDKNSQKKANVTTSCKNVTKFDL
jgi:hypothetical protein